MQKEAIVQKTKIGEAFDKMKLKGKMDPNIMSKLGINTSSNSQERVASNYQGSMRSPSPGVSHKQMRVNQARNMSMVPPEIDQNNRNEDYGETQKLMVNNR